MPKHDVLEHFFGQRIRDEDVSLFSQRIGRRDFEQVAAQLLQFLVRIRDHGIDFRVGIQNVSQSIEH